MWVGVVGGGQPTAWGASLCQGAAAPSTSTPPPPLLSLTPLPTHTPQRQHLAALVGQVVDEFAVLAVLAHQRLAQLKHGGVDRHSAVALEHCTQGRGVGGGREGVSQGVRVR